MKDYSLTGKKFSQRKQDRQFLHNRVSGIRTEHCVRHVEEGEGPFEIDLATPDQILFSRPKKPELRCLQQAFLQKRCLVHTKEAQVRVDLDEHFPSVETIH